MDLRTWLVCGTGLRSTVYFWLQHRELEKGAKDWKYIDELQKKKALHKKKSKENKTEKERIIQLRKELAMANRERDIFCCFVCSRVFLEEEAMREHVTVKHLAFKKGYDFKCTKCYRRFNTNQKLARHLRTHTTADIRCNICNREFRYVLGRNFFKNPHEQGSQYVSARKQDWKAARMQVRQKRLVLLKSSRCRHRYYCDFREDIAEKRRRARQELDAMSTVSSPPPSIISSCSESASTVSIGSASGRPIKDKSCPFCFLVCASMQSRKRHIERAHPERLKDVEVDQHSYIKVQSPALPFACDLCSKTFASHASLSTHKKRIHENRKDHECTVCGKRYPLPSELRKHVKRVHEKN
ncbi:zinc finger, C2H2 type [Oesophagostomum dentatum]|uniref:Zinc finger, C2H2 type n=1 Tax=Oesophagostomum dentatum TaxID=61180 RepID=A0A0B1TTY7_OESDE|nr:zinc finger, C2H2 type [Oesophagostomum dentatum]